MRRYLFFLLLLPNLLFAQAGSLNTSFGANGVFTFHPEELGARDNQIIELSDGHFLFCGNSILSQYGAQFPKGFYIAKISSEGLLDLNFGNNGSIFFPDENQGETKFKSFIQRENNKILISGMINGTTALIQLDEDGEMDNNFGNNGIVYIEGNLSWIALQNDKIIVLSYQFYPEGGMGYLLTRRDYNGNIDFSFGQDGMVELEPTIHTFNSPTGLLIQSDEKILILGQAYGGNVLYPGYGVITRLTENGSYDINFGDNGVIVHQSEEYIGSQLEDIDIQNDGKIVVCGTFIYENGTGGFAGSKPVVLRYHTTGVLDHDFGENGKVIFVQTVFNANDGFRRIGFQNDGKIVLGGRASFPYPYMRTYLYLTRIHSDGTKDASFGDNGVVYENFTNTNSNNFTNYIEEMVISENGMITVAGHKTDNMIFRETFIAQFLNDYPSGFHLSFPEKETAAYPNPTTHFMTIKNTFSPFSLYSASGQPVFVPYSEDIQGLKLDMSQLASGIYFLKTSETTTKIVKNR